MLRLTTRRLLYRTIATIWVSYRGLCLSVPLPSSRSGTTIVPLSIYISLSLEVFAFLSSSRPLASLPLRAAATAATLLATDHSFSLARSPRVPVSIFLSLMSSVRLSLSSSLSCAAQSPSRSRLHRTGGAPADFAFKFGKFAGVGKWAAGMVSNTRARARPPIHCV